MQFQTPQFIETEAKIVGPLTLKQFLIVGAAVIGSLMLFYVLATWLWFIVTCILVGGAITLALIKINGQSMSIILISAIKFFWQPKLYVWQRKNAVKEIEIVLPKKEPLLKILREKLLTTKIPLPKREKPAKKTPEAPLWKSLFPEKQHIEILSKLTGEKEVARRIDYR